MTTSGVPTIAGSDELRDSHSRRRPIQRIDRRVPSSRRVPARSRAMACRKGFPLNAFCKYTNVS